MRSFVLVAVGLALSVSAACGGKTSDIGGPGGTSGAPGSGGDVSGGGEGGGGAAGANPGASGADAPAKPPTETCSDGPPYPPGASFTATPPSTDLTGLPQCVFHCGDPVYDTFSSAPTIASLPSGACANAGEQCQMNAEYTCPCKPGQKPGGPLGSYRCACTGGAWLCQVFAQGMSICTCDGQPPGP